MPYAIGRVPDPLNGRIGLQGSRHLAERFSDAKDMALKAIPEGEPERDGIPGLMVSEENIDLCFTAVRQYKARTAKPINPLLQAEYELLCAEQHQYNAVLVDIDELQKKALWRFEHDWKHRLLRSVKADHFSKLAPIDTDWPVSQYPDIASARAERKKVRAMLDYASELRGQIGNAATFNEIDPVAQHEHLLHAAYDTIEELRHDMKNLQSVVAALQAELHRKPKQRKA